MEKNVLSLVMDTIGIIGMFFIAAVLLCVINRKQGEENQEENIENTFE